ncbi:MAG: Rne/Rng family ribonuclease [Armatimonadota bacterium]|nr:Rne/Rng family ribonuclease [Armatimonadota bacterium]MDR7466937.1 Rne/Rng family ribonuclease [Armatimonadota bacterium]MDR7493521.1 Rne/Rng family ribonuclease [Armatimonadota bacterium]MDR7503824.1 Rne/Rng family ribonuclease [Armatimonadota bacterium]MDR7546522.1 Rne/Rng family ribonuclease [Armatimonadota bacterium]
MTKEIIANIDPLETRVAVREEGQLVNLYIERGEPLAGNIYKGRVANVLPGMEAAFVDIGLERNAFLHVGDIRSQRLAGEEVEESFGKGAIAQRLRVGQEILVQVTKEPMGTKGARVTTYIALPAYHLVLMPTVNYVGVSRRIEDEQERKRLRQLADRLRPKGIGVIVRTAAAGAKEQALADDLKYLLQLWNRVEERSKNSRAPALVYQDLHLIRRVVRDLFTAEVDRFLIDAKDEFQRVQDLLSSFAPELKPRVHLYQGETPVFEHTGVERELEKALHRKVWLRSGGYIVVDRTEALTIIDVNTGKYVGKTDLASTILRTNLEAVDEIVRQIRLRDIGGIILVDFIDMESEAHRKKVMAALQEAVRRDRSKVHVIDLTALGLVEITRKRVYQDLEEVMREPCPYCEGRGRVFTAETMALRIRRDLRRFLRSAKGGALLVEVHPDVYRLLTAGGEGWVRPLEDQTGKRLRLRSREGMHVERVRLVEAGSVEGLEEAARSGQEQIFWIAHEPADAVRFAEPDEEQEVALVGAGRRDGLLVRLRRLLGGS